MADIFISYAREDQERVRPLARALESKGFTVWWDHALASGDDYTRVIERELAAAKAVIVVWTDVSVHSAFVRDEAGRARDLGRLAPVALDKGVQPPLGFGSFQAEDFSDWNGSASAPQLGLLEESLRARIEGRAIDGGAVQARRKRAAARIRFMSILGVVATVLVIAASVAVLTGRAVAPPAPASQQDQLAQLLDLVAQGKLTGDQALQLAKLLQAGAFDEAAAREPSGADAALVAPASATQAERAAIERAPVPVRADMIATARTAFEDSAAALLIDPDVRVREAVLKTRMADTRQEGMDALWTLAKEGGASASATWRACGSLMLAMGDPRALRALENARALNPQNKDMWRLLSYAYARENKPREAAGAALVGDGIGRAGERDWQGAQSRLDLALPLLRDRETKGFVLSQMGDAAAARQDWAGAERSYRSALESRDAEKDAAAISLDSSRLARVLMKQGDSIRACLTLRRAVRLGADVPAAEIDETCGPSLKGAPASTSEIPRETVVEPGPARTP